jgi:hypothetical protein
MPTLVHDEDAGIQRESLGDLDDLLGADAKAADGRRGRDVEFELTQQVRRGSVHGVIVDEAQARARFAAEKDVLGDSEFGEEVEFLVDDCHAGGLGVAGAGEADELAIDRDLALVGREDPGEDVHERALAGAVFAEQGVESAAADCDLHVVEGAHAGERFADALGGEQDIVGASVGGSHGEVQATSERGWLLSRF